MGTTAALGHRDKGFPANGEAVLPFASGGREGLPARRMASRLCQLHPEGKSVVQVHKRPVVVFWARLRGDYHYIRVLAALNIFILHTEQICRNSNETEG